MTLGISGCCMSTWCHSPIEGSGKPNFIYPGVQEDFRHLPVGLIDFPFSFVLDTIALTWDLHAVCIEGKPRCYYNLPRQTRTASQGKVVVPSQ